MMVRFVDGPRLAPGEPGKFVLAFVGLRYGWDYSPLQPGVTFSILDVRYREYIGTGRVLERLPTVVEEPAGPEVRELKDQRGPPNLLRIPLNEDRFSHVGRLAGGTQFLAYVGGAFPTNYRYSKADWQTHKRWQAVIHWFAADGRHLRTEVRLGGLEIEEPEATAKAWRHLHSMYDEMAASGEPEFCDIYVKLFSVEIDGIRYGLFHEQGDEEEDKSEERSECVRLQPRDIVFGRPWDSGSYST
jgi:hypothetical protein